MMAHSEETTDLEHTGCVHGQCPKPEPCWGPCEDKKTIPDRYMVRTRFHHHGDMTENLSFEEAIRLIQDRFQQSNGAVYFASIQREESKQ